MKNVERRYMPFAEFRAVDGGKKLRGHFATYQQPYSLGMFDEQIAPEAFDGVWDDDVRALFNHDQNFPLGRTKAGTLKLSNDATGPVAEIDLPESATMLREAIERGDVDQMSFGFTVAEDAWEVTNEETGRELRTITKIGRLFDVSPVTFPANPNTDIAMRSLSEFRNETYASGVPVEEKETETEASGVATEQTVVVTTDAQFQNKRRLDLLKK
jgi:HK97 family phage prohead protease